MEIKFENITKDFKGTRAVDSFSYEMHPGVIALLGPNGAGKSTLMNILAGIMLPTSGSIKFNGEDIGHIKDYSSHIGYLPQDAGLYDFFDATDNMRYFAHVKAAALSEEEIKERLKALNLGETGKKKYKAFSGGMKRRLAIAVTLINDPDILILDEPTSGLDPKERFRIKNIIRSLKKDRIVILSTHIVSDVEELADEVIFLGNGEIKKTVRSADPEFPNLESAYMSIFGENADD